MGLHWSSAPQRDTLVVEETLDSEGDIMYGVRMMTYCRTTINKLEELLHVRVVIRPYDDTAHDNLNDW